MTFVVRRWSSRLKGITTHDEGYPLPITFVSAMIVQTEYPSPNSEIRSRDCQNPKHLPPDLLSSVTENGGLVTSDPSILLTEIVWSVGTCKRFWDQARSHSMSLDCIVSFGD